MIADDLEICHVTLGVMMGKAVKLAAVNLDTHSKKVTMDKDFISAMLREAGCDDATLERAEKMTLARELWDIIPKESIQAFCNVMIRHCIAHCKPLLPSGILTILLIDDNGRIYEYV
jgi:cobalt-precorrin-5B (C1)-methyltransferase